MSPSLVYIDTNIILDVVVGRRRSSTTMLETIKNKKGWKCCTSHFALMEALGVRQEYAYIKKKLQDEESLDKILRNRHNRDLSEEELEREYDKIYNLFFAHYEKDIEFWYLTNEGWVLAIDIMREFNISAQDVIHLATALESDCEYFVSADKSLVKIAEEYISACSPEKFCQILEKSKKKKKS